MLRTRQRRGAASVELALTLPWFCLMMFGAIDVGWLFFQRSALDSSASIGCRAGALVDPGIDDVDMSVVESTAQAKMVAALEETGGDCSGSACTTTVSTFGSSPGRSLVCTVTYEFMPIIGWVLGEMTLASTQVVRMEWQR